MPAPDHSRDYREVEVAVRRAIGDGDAAARMRAVVDAVWSAHGGEGDGRGVSWVGFYLPVLRAGCVAEMELGPSRNKPACSPIPMHGACGQSFDRRVALVIPDVGRLTGYVACDPLDRSEVVVPMLTADGCAGVLDLDSHAPGAFTTHDALALLRLLEQAGLSRGGSPVEVIGD